jgi:glucose-1-phosphate adenylyltransferase
MKRVLSIILGGGAGTRLYPLTKLRAKPAVPLAGKYRLIDIPVSNCINSEIFKIYVLTQFNSASLNRHIARTYSFSGFNDGFVEVLAAQQTPENPNWFQGTADAVRQYIWLLEEWNVDEYLILSGDHLYRMDYRQFVQRHRETKADITLSVVPMDERRASDFGLMKIDNSGRIIDFSEKPKGNELAKMQVDTTLLGLTPEQAKKQPYIASMGIYVFKKEVLIKLLKESLEQTDFGKEIIPNSAKDYNVQAYLFDGYWEDIGTIEAFYDANLALTRQPQPPFSFYDEEAPIYTRSRYLPLASY